MKIVFIGTGACTPEIGQEVASFVINGNILVDTGWCNVLKMREYGLDPMDIRYLILTHLHQDHYLGLPQLLFYLWAHRVSRKSVSPLVIIGPSQHLNEIVAASKAFLQIKRFSEIVLETDVVPLVPGKTYKGADFVLETIAAKHFSGGGGMEEALSCKITYPSTAQSMVFSGDTSFHPPLAELARKTPMLIHDACHSAPAEAARIAQMADAERLYLIHCQEKAVMMDDVRRIFPRAFMARDGLTVEL
ncbi:MAG: MBL fold metallo-hydrolase [Verrucomicrobia bacterium]|nr:MBL fold metallo-hydrolase [Verrucomicrobiota bacterium]MBU1736240.1 MBL fold metallo-hydrolase [Verrucomicrobiota bacterium]MBU1855740.1 MBL fold metallo-hydrolase [Verrucomicrobiota bacterium]